MKTGINLGFENLLSKGDDGAAGVLSYEYLDQLVKFHEATADILATCNEVGQAYTAFENLSAITGCIKKYGVTQSLEAMYGENFSSATSMEAEGEEAKKGIIKRLIEWIQGLIEKLKNWWSNFTGVTTKAMAAARNCKFGKPFKFTGVTWGNVDIASGDAKLKSSEMVVDDASQFETVKTMYTNAISKIHAEQKKLEGELKAAADLLKQGKDEAIQKDKDLFSKKLTSITTIGRQIAGSLNSFVAAANKAGKAEAAPAAKEEKPAGEEKK